MDLLKAKIYLDKINREMTRMLRDPETIVRIEQDIVLSYIRELYDALQPDPDSTVSPSTPQTPVRKSAPNVAPKASPAPPPVEAPPAVQETPPTFTPAPEPPPQPVFVSPEVPLSPPSSSGITSSVEQLFSFKEAKELSEKLADQPVSDLRQAISLNDRLQYTRELFSGDQQAFEQTLNILNTLNVFEQAKLYLIDHCVQQYGWTDKSRVELAKKFVRLARRRFV
ncbi:MAG: hypothetical protein ACOYNO_07425 [Saprospiraceae bacterium]